MIVQALSAVYGAAASWRRRWYGQHPARVRTLNRPVISVGNLGVGGTGKTPAVAVIARCLIERGERPSILSRGYARRRAARGVTVVSDGRRVLADLPSAGDEPLLLARLVEGTPVLVCPDRYQAGRQAEDRFGVTVHLLDDGFQHLQLARDVDLLMLDERDLSDRVLPGGRLREPLSSAAAADAVILVSGAGTAGDVSDVARTLGVEHGFRMTRRIGAPRLIAPADRAGEPVEPGTPVFALAGIARPERFFSDLRAAGWTVTGVRAFRDHHPFSGNDLERVAAEARASGAAAILTTGKDAVRLRALDLPAVALAEVPLTAAIEPAPAFADWLLARVRRARERP